MTTQYKYMENACSTATAMTDHGIKWDWQSFFWQVWETGTYKLELADVVELWPAVWSDWHYRQWPDIDSDANSYLSAEPMKYLYFRQHAFDIGIDH